MLGLLSILAIAILSSPSFSHFAALLVGGIYPAYKSFQALQNNDAATQKRWLAYWAVASVFLVPDIFFGTTLIIRFIRLDLCVCALMESQTP